jgi:hypothetical protein
VVRCRTASIAATLWISLVCACQFDPSGADPTDAGAPLPSEPPDAAPPADAPPPPCPPDARQDEGLCVRLEATPRTWDEAAAACAAAGGRLALVLDERAATAVNASAAGAMAASYWLGASDRATEGEWRWADGAPLAFTAWGNGQPNDATSPEEQDCLVVRTGGRWYDDDCATPQASVCEWPAPR